MKGPQRVLVVDADVARAAGPEPRDRRLEHPRSAHCRRLLEAIRVVKSYRLAFDDRLFAEWRRHAGPTARRWLADMTSRRRILKVEGVAGDWVFELIDDSPLDDAQRRLAEKDRHLLGLAHHPGDGRILSGDRRASNTFRQLRHDPRVARIHWVEPGESARRWLLDGAPDDDSLTLGRG